MLYGHETVSTLPNLHTQTGDKSISGKEPQDETGGHHNKTWKGSYNRCLRLASLFHTWSFMKKDRNSLYSANPELSSACSHISPHMVFTYPTPKPAHLPLPHHFHWCTAYLSLEHTVSSDIIKHDVTSTPNTNLYHLANPENCCGSEFGKLLLFFQNISKLKVIRPYLPCSWSIWVHCHWRWPIALPRDARSSFCRVREEGRR